MDARMVGMTRPGDAPRSSGLRDQQLVVGHPAREGRGEAPRPAFLAAGAAKIAISTPKIPLPRKHRRRAARLRISTALLAEAAGRARRPSRPAFFPPGGEAYVARRSARKPAGCALQELLGIEPSGRDDTGFRASAGHSLLAGRSPPALRGRDRRRAP